MELIWGDYKMEKKKLETLCLDGLKGIGIFIIAFFWHYQHFTGANANLPLWRFFPLSYQYGYLMVEVFFMLSGFGMIMGYQDKILKKEITFKEYIFKRIKKIYPVFLLTLLLTTSFEMVYYKLYGSFFVYPNFDLYHFVLNLLCLQDGIFENAWSFNSPSWCISICFIMYCVLYYVVYKSKNKNEVLYKFIFILCFSYLLFRVNFISEILNRGVMSFSVGVILAYIYDNREKFNYKLVGYLSLGFLVLAFLIFKKNMIYTGNIAMLMTLGIGPAIILTLLFNELFNNVFRFKIFQFLGSISISIYLFHFPMQCLIKIIDKYFHLHINYYSKFTWCIYVIITIFISIIYQFIINKKYSNKLFYIFNKTKNTKK